jgi:predicted nucleic acid-binding protein
VEPRQIVLDTNVVYSALRSREGASFRLLGLVGTGRFEINLSVPLVLEYQDICLRLVGPSSALTADDVDAVIDYLCRVGNHRAVYYLWRPALSDPQDDMVLELAVASQADVVTFNVADFRGGRPVRGTGADPAAVTAGTRGGDVIVPPWRRPRLILRRQRRNIGAWTRSR